MRPADPSASSGCEAGATRFPTRRSANLDAKGFADDLHGHADLHLLVGLHLLQIDVQVFVGQRIALDFLEEGEGLFSLILALSSMRTARPANRLEEANKLRGV
jgi:hypothetical protein